MSENAFLTVDHEEALALLVLLRRHEEDLNNVLEGVLLKTERRLFAVHSIEEMESLVSNATGNKTEK